MLFKTLEQDDREEICPGRLQPLVNCFLLLGIRMNLDIVEGIDPFLPDLVVLCPEKH